MHYTLLIFDWEGTLVDPSGRVVHSVQAVASEHGLPVPTPNLVHTAMRYSTTEDCLVRLFPQASERERQRFYVAHQQYLDREWLKPALFPGVLATLVKLRQQGHSLAIATGKSTRGLHQALDQLKIAHLFSVTRTAEQTQPKPHPQMIEEVLREIGLTAERALMIGDTPCDLELARNAGIDAVAVLHDSPIRQELQAEQPRTVLDYIHELPGWLSQHHALAPRNNYL